MDRIGDSKDLNFRGALEGCYTPQHQRLPRLCLSGSVHKVVLQKSMPAQIRQLFLYYYYIWDELTDLCGN